MWTSPGKKMQGVTTTLRTFFLLLPGTDKEPAIVEVLDADAVGGRDRRRCGNRSNLNLPRFVMRPWDSCLTAIRHEYSTGTCPPCALHQNMPPL